MTLEKKNASDEGVTTRDAILAELEVLRALIVEAHERLVRFERQLSQRRTNEEG